MGQNIITLSKFISRYLGVNGQPLRNLSHEDAKHLFPNLRRATFSYIESHPIENGNGNIVLVTDGRKTIPYYTPELVQNDFEVVEVKSNTMKATRTVPDYANMKIYELKKLLNVKINGRLISRCARRELYDRGVVLGKKYKRQEFKKWEEDYERN